MGALQDLAHKNASVAKTFTDILDEEVGPLRTDLNEVKEKMTGEVKQYIERVEQDLRKTEAELKALKTILNRPGTVGGYDSPEVKEQHKQASKSAFDKALRRGWASLSQDERKHVRHDDEFGMVSGEKLGHGQELEHKAMFGSDNTGGGFLAVPEFVSELIEAIVQISDFHSLVNVRMTSNPWVKIPKRTQTASAARTPEQATRGETQNPKFGMVSLMPYESYGLSLISVADLEDSEIDLAAFIQAELAEQFAKLEGYEIANGTGVGANQCAGFLNDSGITGTAYSGSGGAAGYTTSSASGGFAYTDLVDQLHALKPAYRKGASWVFTTETLGDMRKLTDSQNRPLWGPMGADVPGQLLGYPYAEMVDMPAVATGKFPIAFGNWKKGYTLVIRRQISIRVLNERYADQNAIGYMGYYRFGGSVTLSEAIRAMKIA